MEIIISNSSDKPIYEQICMQVKNLIMNGTLSAGEALPSMRVLAKDLHISVITVQRAYEDLTRDGFIETVSGKGSFVAAQNKEFIQEEYLGISNPEKQVSKDTSLFYVYEYTIALFRHTRRGHWIPLQIAVSHHVVAGN